MSLKLLNTVKLVVIRFLIALFLIRFTNVVLHSLAADLRETSITTRISETLGIGVYSGLFFSSLSLKRLQTIIYVDVMMFLFSHISNANWNRC